MKKRHNMGPSHAQENGPRAVRGLLITALMLLSIVTLLIVGTTTTVALDPHVISGTVYEANGTTVPVNTTVTILNSRTGESSTADTNATGVYAFNLLNLPSGWAFGDSIQVNATNATSVAGINSTQILVGMTSTVIDIWIGTTTAVSGVNFYIIDDDGYPVESAMINIKDYSGDIVTTKLSDSYGKASTTLSDGLFTLTVSKSGFADRVILARVHGFNTYTVRLGTEAEGLALTNLWYWGMIILAIFGIIAILTYVAKKV